MENFSFIPDSNKNININQNLMSIPLILKNALKYLFGNFKIFLITFILIQFLSSLINYLVVSNFTNSILNAIVDYSEYLIQFVLYLLFCSIMFNIHYNKSTNINEIIGKAKLNFKNFFVSYLATFFILDLFLHLNLLSFLNFYNVNIVFLQNLPFVNLNNLIYWLLMFGFSIAFLSFLFIPFISGIYNFNMKESFKIYLAIFSKYKKRTFLFLIVLMLFFSLIHLPIDLILFSLPHAMKGILLVNVISLFNILTGLYFMIAYCLYIMNLKDNNRDLQFQEMNK